MRSMSRAGTPTDNAAMESIIGWVKEEIFNDFNIKDSDDPVKTIESYIKFFNEEKTCICIKLPNTKTIQRNVFK